MSRVGSATPSANAPVEDLTGAGILAVDQQEVGPEIGKAVNGAVPGGEGLDDGVQAGPDPGRFLRRLVAVELRRAQSGGLDRLDHPLGGLVAEHADGQNLRRQPLGDVTGQLDRDLADRWGEDESHCGSAEPGRQ